MRVLSLGELQQITDMLYGREIAQKFLIVVYIVILLDILLTDQISLSGCP